MSSEKPHFSERALATIMEKSMKYKDVKELKKVSFPCPLCKIEVFDELVLRRHINRRHTTHEVAYLLQKYTSKSSAPQTIKVRWVGKSTTVPPLPSPIPLNICFNHFPPHPKCLICHRVILEGLLFPPLKFYASVFVEKVSDDEQKSNSSQTFHFNTCNKERSVLAKIMSASGIPKIRTGRIEAMCEDRLGAYLIGIRYYLSYYEIKENIIDKLNYCWDYFHTYDIENEVVLDMTTISFIKMNDVTAQGLIIACDKHEYDYQLNMRGLKTRRGHVKFYQYTWDGVTFKKI